MNPETHLKRAIIDAVNASGLAKVWNSPAGVARVRRGYVHMAPRGTADVSGHTRFGRAVYLEVKLPKGVVSPEQAQFIADAKAVGCIAGVVRSVGEAIELLATTQSERAIGLREGSVANPVKTNQNDHVGTQRVAGERQ